jgi:hypothetical protein
MLKGRRCYCNRLYPGFRCAYCRLGDVLADEEQPDPRTTPEVKGSAGALTKLWGRVAAYGKSMLGGQGRKP